MYRKLTVLIKKINEDSDFNLFILTTGSVASERHGTSLVEIKNDGYSPYVINSMVDGDTPCELAKSGALQIIELSIFFDKNKPDLVILVGDRWELIPICKIIRIEVIENGY